MSADPLRYFRIEAGELLERLTEGLLALERGEADPEGVRALLRHAHTLKGAARVVREQAIAENAHALENGLAELRDAPDLSEAPGRAAGLIAHLDAIAARVREIARPAQQAAAGASTTPAAPVALASAGEALDVLRVEVAELDRLTDALESIASRLDTAQGALNGLQGIRRVAQGLVHTLHQEGTRRRADELTGRLLRASEGLEGALAELDRTAGWSLDGALRALRHAREQVLSLRLVPASAVLPQLQRAVRDAAAEEGREAAFAVEGGQARLDGPVLALAREALLHLVRNAVAHGIEPPDARERAGKPRQGMVRLKVETRGNRVAFSCRDDGGGVDVDRVAERARALGLIPPGADEVLTPQAVLDVLTHPGFSIREEAGGVAGRGVGLDVVRQVANRVGGELTLAFEPGRFTEFTLLLPPSLASMRVLKVEAAGRVAWVPLDSVRWTTRVRREALSEAGGALTLLHEEDALPFAPLSRLLSPERGNGAPEGSALVLEAGGGLCALGVDRLRGLAEIVLRPVPATAGAVPLLRGVALNAAGDPEPVLEPRALLDAIRAAGVPPTEQPHEPPLVLVVDDSLTTRMLEQSILESAGFRVELAASGEEGLAKARALRPALLLVDVEMPGIDGFEVVSRLGADPELRETPAVLVTSRGSAEDRRRGLTAGARGYIVKSEFSQEGLLRTIRGLVGT